MTECTDLMMVTYNRLALTRRTLDNLFAVTRRPFRLIVVDNASGDGTVAYLRERLSAVDSDYFVGWKLHQNQTNKGIAVGRNQGLRLSEANWLATLDNDVLLPEGWLTECIGILTANRKFGAVGVSFEAKNYPLVVRGGFEFEVKKAGNLGTACMVFSRALFEKIGYFNTDYKMYAHEDADWGWRVRTLGFKLGYIKRHGIHLGEDSGDTGEYREMKNRFHARNLPLFFENCKQYASRKKSVFLPFKDA